MSRFGRVKFGRIRSVGQRLKEWAVSGITQDVRDGKQWAADSIPYGIARVVEKWIGFWLAFLLVSFLGWGGLVLIEAARGASDIMLLANTVPRAILFIGSIGILVVFLTGIWLLAIVVVSAVRVLFWLRTVWKNYWNKHTPRFTDSDAETNTPEWPPSDDEEDEAQSKVGQFALNGGLAFMGLMMILLQLEMNYPDRLHATVSSPELSLVSDVVNAALWVVNIEGLFETISANVSQAWVVYAILIFGLPGIFFVVAGRNLLFLTESFVGNHIETVAEKGVLNWTGLKLAGYFFAFSLWALGIVSRVFSTL